MGTRAAPHLGNYALHDRITYRRYGSSNDSLPEHEKSSCRLFSAILPSWHHPARNADCYLPFLCCLTCSKEGGNTFAPAFCSTVGTVALHASCTSCAPPAQGSIPLSEFRTGKATPAGCRTGNCCPCRLCQSPAHRYTPPATLQCCLPGPGYAAPGRWRRPAGSARPFHPPG